MPKPEPKTAADIVFEDAIYDVKQAAAKVGVHHSTIRKAIKSGELPAFIPRGKEPGFQGPRLGYRIKSADLQRWYFG